jgi:hypothetical protein
MPFANKREKKIMFKRSVIALIILSTFLFTGCIITGKVTDENGNGIEGVTVTLTGAASLTTTTDNSGRYKFGNYFDIVLKSTTDPLTHIISGDYVVTPSKDGYYFTPESRNVSVGSNSQDLPLPVGEVDFKSAGSNDIIKFAFYDDPAQPSGVTGNADNSKQELTVVGVANPGASQYVSFLSEPIPLRDLRTTIFEADISLPTGLRTGLPNSSDPLGDRSSNSMGTPVLFRIFFTWTSFVEISMQSTYGLNLEQVINSVQPSEEISLNGGLAVDYLFILPFLSRYFLPAICTNSL